MNNALTKITTRAKQIRKAHKSMSWIDAVKKAGAEYRSTHKKKPVRRTAKRKSSKKLGSTLLLERGESARKKPSRVIQVKRTRAGTYKKFSAVSGVKRKRARVTGDYSSKRVVGVGQSPESQKREMAKGYNNALHIAESRKLIIIKLREDLKKAKKYKDVFMVRHLNTEISMQKRLLTRDNDFIRAVRRFI